MAKRYHISDDGTPGVCSAQSADSCPKTRAGDDFHGTLEEATLESERRFEAEHDVFVTNGKSTAPRKLSYKEQMNDLRASVEDANAGRMTKPEEDYLKSYWKEQGLINKFAAASRIGELEFQSRKEERPRVEGNPGSTVILAGIIRSPLESGKRSSIGERVIAGDLNMDTAKALSIEASPQANLAFDIAYNASDSDRDYLLNDVATNDLKVFTGDKKMVGKGNIKELVKIHRSMVDRYQGGLPTLQLKDQLPADSRDEYIEDSNRSGIGSLRPWGRPSNSIQNMGYEMGEMLGQHVIDRYGAENAESFWSKASATSGPNRATLAQVFKTMREFDKERGIKD